MRFERVGRFRYFIEDDRWEWSDAVARMHGYEPGTVTPTTELILSHKHPDDKPNVAQIIEQVRRFGNPFSSRHRIVDARGQIHVVVVVGDRLYDDKGDVIGTIGFYTDITESFDHDVRQTLDDVALAIAEHRAVINYAVGVLMAAYGIPADRAAEVLRWQAREGDVTVRQLAAQFIADVTADPLMPPATLAQIDHLLLTAHHRLSRRDSRAKFKVD